MKLTEDKSVKVFRKDGTSTKGIPYTLYSLSVSTKDRDGSWNNAYIDCGFKKGVEVGNGAKIKINNAFPTVRSFGDKKSVRWMITDFEVIEEGTPSADTQAAKSSGMDFMDIPDGIDEQLPFE